MDSSLVHTDADKDHLPQILFSILHHTNHAFESPFRLNWKHEVLLLYLNHDLIAPHGRQRPWRIIKSVFGKAGY